MAEAEAGVVAGDARLAAALYPSVRRYLALVAGGFAVYRVAAEGDEAVIRAVGA